MFRFIDRDSDAVIVHRPTGTVSRRQLYEQAAALSAKLPDSDVVINLCQDRYWFMLGLLAALLREQTSLLPSSQAVAAIEKVAAQHDRVYCLTDSEWIVACRQYRVDLAGCGGVAADRTITESAASAVIVYTSGSTGEPCAHIKHWRELLAGNRLLAQRLGLLQDQLFSIIATVPSQHMYGFETTVLLPFCANVSVFSGRPFYPEDLHQALSTCPAPRVLISTPVHLSAFVRADADWPALDCIVSSTGPLAPELAEQLRARFKCPVHEIYGSTETGAIASRAASEEYWTLLDDMRIEPENNQHFIYGPQLHQPQAMQDLIEPVSESQFRLIGRSADMIKVAGKRASLGDLTRSLQSVPGVVDGAFVRDDDSRRGLSAVVVAPDISDVEIRQYLLKLIDPVFVPRHFVRVAVMPRNETGKLPAKSLLDIIQSERKSE